ncbi:MAG: TIGR02147 family protein [Deltaproteobacteria bacterium]|nr:TIGR02147 family protein [Deltaproteobacteria bacterium]
MRKPASVDLFLYTDYRLYLRDWYTSAKKRRGSFSFRAFSKAAGFDSPNFLKMVMDGDRNLTEASLAKFVVGLSLNKQEEEFFRNLVFFNQSKTNEARQAYYEKLVQSRKFKKLKPIETDQYEYYSAWYHPVIRELVLSKNFDGTPEWLSSRVNPPITPYQAKRSVELLEKIGFIKKNDKGEWNQAMPLVTTGAESSSLVLLKYHQNLLELVRQVLAETDPSKRDVSALTLGVAKERIPELKTKIREFREEILKMVSNDNNPEEVVILSLQMFPVTKEQNEVF